MATYTVRDFLFDSFRLISASNPVIPLRGTDESLGLRILNQLLLLYASNGLMLTIAKTVTAPVNLGNNGVIFTDPTFVPPPPIPGQLNPVQITSGRLAQVDSAWLLLSGVTYPLILKSRDEYLSAWKYEPLQGLPRFLITFPDTDIVFSQLYPAPSQFFDFFARGKFQLSELTKDSDMSSLPQYYQLFFLYAVAKDVAFFTGRANAWTEKLEMRYRELEDVVISASEINLEVTGDEQSLLNGAWRVRAGI